MKKYDLHIHSKYSDGTDDIDTIINKSKNIGLAGIAITDHDNIDSIRELNRKQLHDIAIIPGTELSCYCDTGDLHILGYGMSLIQDQDFIDALEDKKNARRTRFIEMIDRLNNIGISIRYEDVKNRSLGRPYLAKLLIENGKAANIQEAFDKYLAKGKSIYVSKKKFDYIDAIKLIIKAGGIPVVAHPKLIKNDDLISNLIQAGIKGIEAYYPKHNETETEKYINIANDNGLYITGGSDYHGTNKDNVTIGQAFTTDEKITGLLEIMN